jgi:hypothetical protein
MVVSPEERVARNNATFREANEGIREKVDREGPPMTTIPFLCECPREDCRELVPMSLGAYVDIRAEPTRFLNAPGHEEAEGDSAVVVERREKFVIVDKVGLSRDVAVDDWAGRKRA